MSVVARVALAIAVLIVLGGGAFIFLVLPRLVSAIDSAPPALGSPPVAVADGTTRPSPAVLAPETPAPEPATPPAIPSVPPGPAPAPEPLQPSPAEPAPAQPSPAQPSPAQPAPVPATPAAGMPIPLSPPQAAAFNPAEPGAGNIARLVNQTMVMAGTADARALPLAAAPVLTRLDKGSSVQVLGVLTGNLWLEVELPDQRAAYIPAAALPGALAMNPVPDAQGAAIRATAPPAPQPAPSLPDTLSGRVKVISTATLVVDGQKIQLYGIRGERGAYAAQLRALIESQGGAVDCRRQGTAYVCTLPGGLDIARAALFNGAATPAATASADYQTQAAAARAAGRGLWAH